MSVKGRKLISFGKYGGPGPTTGTGLNLDLPRYLGGVNVKQERTTSRFILNQPFEKFLKFD